MGQIILRLDRLMVETDAPYMAPEPFRGKRCDSGYVYVNLSKLKNNHVSAIRFSTLAAICEALHCQPGDILEYVESGE